MNLQPSTDPEQPGLWINPEWQEGSPGTFAVVIGVSRYRHLEGGDAPAQDHGERWIREARALGQLSVSALTAFKFFEWLADAYRYEAAPIAKCWFLVAPTAAEEELGPAMSTHTSDPTLDRCRLALRNWCATMRDLSKTAKMESRAIFFFSGHGIEVIADRQILLPSDYLQGSAPSCDDAISTQNLIYGLEHVKLRERYYFLDACRNNTREICLVRPKGQELLQEHIVQSDDSGADPGTASVAVLYATMSSLQAWQPIEPGNGPSIYGRALLDGLFGQPDIELEPKNGSVTVKFDKLEDFVKERVVALLQELEPDRAHSQPIQPAGRGSRRIVVTEIPAGRIAAIRPEVMQPPKKGLGGVDFVIGARSSVERADDVLDLRTNALANMQSLDPELQNGIWTAPWDTQHRVFGSERVTDLWTRPGRMQVRAIGRGTRVNHTRLRLNRIAWDRMAWHHDRSLLRTYEAVLEVDDDDRRGYWLRLTDTAPIAYGCILPSDRTAPLRYLIEFEVELDPGGTELTLRRLSASLAPGNPGPLAAAARLWQRYRDADVTQAVSDFELSELEQMVREKLASPLAATVAALVLLRANRLDLLHDWPRNLANWIEELPDGCVLWAEQIMRQEPDRKQAVQTAVEFLGQLVHRGLPVTTEAFSYAVTLLDRLAPAVADLPEGPRSRFERVKARIDAAVAFFRPGGLFTTYSHFVSQTAPSGAQLPASQPGTKGSAPPSAPSPLMGVGEDWVDIGGVVLSRRRPRD